jgi:hypothetical protein
MSPDSGLHMASYLTIIIAPFKANVYRFLQRCGDPTRLRQAWPPLNFGLYLLTILTSKVWPQGLGFKLVTVAARCAMRTSACSITMADSN